METDRKALKEQCNKKRKMCKMILYKNKAEQGITGYLEEQLGFWHPSLWRHRTLSDPCPFIHTGASAAEN